MKQYPLLFKLNAFASKNRIEFGVTGTYALNLLGVPSSSRPGNIDIKIFHITDEIRAKLQELDFLSGITTKQCPNAECYSFLIDDMKVNAIVDKESDYDEIDRDFLTLNLIDEERACHHSINVQRVEQALADKKSLSREKDYKYMLDLIAEISSHDIRPVE